MKRLLFEDLQHTVDYWLGNIHYNTGNNHKCYKVWKRYLDNSDKCFYVTTKKIDRILDFMNKYEVLSNSIEELKRNINLVKKFKFSQIAHNNTKNLSTANVSTNSTNLEKNYMIRTKSNANNSTKNSSKSKLIALNNKVSYYLETIQNIKEIEANVKLFKNVLYEYYKALSLFYVDKSVFDSIKILFNVINSKKHFMPAHFLTWKIICYQQDYKLLLDFSYFMIKVSHQNEVGFNDWVQSYIYYAKALFLNNKSEDAITLLRNILDIFSIIPIDEVKFLSEVVKSNKISSTNVFINFDKALSFYSKYHVYQKNEAIFQLNYTAKKRKTTINQDLFPNGIIEDNACLTSRSGGGMNNGSSVEEGVKIPTIPTPTNKKNKFNELLLTKSDDNFYLNGHPSNFQLSTYSKENNFRHTSQLFNNNSNEIKDLGINNKNKIVDFIQKEIEELEIPNESPCKNI